ncbi:MAG: hypothetical protein WDZ35_00415 [Crocinitomicaceae bacterium]
MKRITSILFFATTLACFSQQNTAEEKIKKYLIGSWEHILSIEPSGEEEVFQRDLELFADGTGTCTRYTAKDTAHLTFEWTVKDSTIYLSVFDGKGVKRTTDKQYITWMGSRMLELHEQFDTGEYGKRCAYRRKLDAAVAQY